LEFNCRFGDPECQALLVRAPGDLVPLLVAAAHGGSWPEVGGWPARASVCVSLASGGYPGKYRTGMTIDGVEAAEARPGVRVFHAGTALRDGRLVTEGGRVLGVTAVGDDLATAGGAAALPGFLASLTPLPVIGVPIAATPLGGLDALLSMAQMPQGVPVATVAIGKWGAANAGILAAQILAQGDPALGKRLDAYRRRLADEVEERARRVAGADGAPLARRPHARPARAAQRSGGGHRRDGHGRRAPLAASGGARPGQRPRRPRHSAERQPERARAPDDRIGGARVLPRRDRPRARRRSHGGGRALDGPRHDRGAAARPAPGRGEGVTRES